MTMTADETLQQYPSVPHGRLFDSGTWQEAPSFLACP